MTCTLCPLHKEALTICVPGRGSETARIMLVGQAPGVKEDCAGEAFVGKAGALLDEMLRDAGFDPQDVYLTNAVRCKPPVEKRTYGERAPNTEEIDACRAHLTQEIHRIKPEVIIALGDVALRSLTRMQGISGKRGKSYPLHPMFAYDCEVWPTWHPAYVLRVPVSRPTVTVDLRRVRDRGLNQEKIQYGVFYSPPRGETVGFNKHTFSLDIECIDREGKIVPEPTQIAFAVDDGCWVGEWPISFSWEGDVVHHNGLEFDLPKLGIPPEGYDTMYLAHLVDENQPLNLEALCVKYLPGVRGWKEDQYAPLGSDELAEYNARDAVNTLRLFHVLKAELGDRIKIYEHIMLPARIALNECSRRGLWIDGEQVEKTRERVVAEIARAKERVLSIASEWIDVTRFNPNSGPQVAALLKQMGYELPKTKKTGADKVDKAVLAAIPDVIGGALLDYRAATKQLSTYITPYARAAKSNEHRMHCDYTVIRTAVGRTSARKSNVQNLDRELDFFSAPPGACYAKADYSALHFRLAAWCANATSILDRYAENPGWDPHKFFAARFYGIPEEQVTKTQRQIAKSANFSQLYMGDEHTLQNYAAKQGITLSLEFCRQLHEAWHQTFPEFIPWYQQVWDDLVRDGYSETATGRRRHFGDVKLLNKLGRAAAHREAVNMRVLGLEPDIALPGLAACHRAGLPINGFFHDANSFEFDNLSAFEDNKEQIRRCMIDKPLAMLRDVFGVDISVPIDIEFTVHENKETI